MTQPKTEPFASPPPADNPPPLSWGILGAARIARKAAVTSIRATGGVVAAIGARSLERAEAFARELEIPRAYEGYQAVIEDPAVQAVYLPLANGLHFRWALACALAGKHCLCEKPLVLTAEEARQLREAFAQADCRLAEGFMWRHHAQTAWIERQLRQGEIGELRRIHAAFSFNLDRESDYRWLDEHGGGSIWDIGVYCINAMRLYFGKEPLQVSARSLVLAPGLRADRSSVGWLDFGADALGTFECSFQSFYDQSLTLTGSEGLIRVERPFPGLPLTLAATIQVGETVLRQTFTPENAYEKMFAHFTRAAHDPSFALQPAEDGLDQAMVMEALAQSAAEGGAPRIVAGY